MKEWAKLIQNAKKAKAVEPVVVTQEQHDVLEALMVAYMSAACMDDGGFTSKKLQTLALAELDTLWDTVIKVGEK